MKHFINANKVNSIMEDIQERKSGWSWESIKMMKKYRSDYIELYCKKKKSKKESLSRSELQRYDELETILPYETIIL